METPITFAPKYLVTKEGEVVSTKFNKRHTLKPYSGTGTSKHPRVGIHLPGGGQKTYPVHLLVATAFLPPKPSPAHEIRHLDGDEQNCRADNLAWGTRSENTLDQVKHGVHNNSRKTHCRNGHEFTPENTRRRGTNGRLCLACNRVSQARYKKRVGG